MAFNVCEKQDIIKNSFNLDCNGNYVYDSAAFAGEREKLLSVLTGGTTFDTRVMNGFHTIQTMTPLEWLFGTLYSEPMCFAAERNLFLASVCTDLFSLGQAAFLNTVSSLIFQYGLVGTILYACYYLLFFRKGSARTRYLCLVNLAAILGESMLFNAYYILFILLEDQNEKDLQLTLCGTV